MFLLQTVHPFFFPLRCLTFLSLQSLRMNATAVGQNKLSAKLIRLTAPLFEAGSLVATFECPGRKEKEDPANKNKEPFNIIKSMSHSNTATGERNIYPPMRNLSVNSSLRSHKEVRSNVFDFHHCFSTFNFIPLRKSCSYFTWQQTRDIDRPQKLNETSKRIIFFSAHFIYVRVIIIEENIGVCFTPNQNWIWITSLEARLRFQHSIEAIF